MSLKNLFRGSEKSQHELTDNPFLNARKQWNFIMGDMVSSRQMWQFAGLFGLLIGLAGIAGMTYIGSQSKFVPYRSVVPTAPPRPMNALPAPCWPAG